MGPLLMLGLTEEEWYLPFPFEQQRHRTEEHFRAQTSISTPWQTSHTSSTALTQGNVCLAHARRATFVFSILSLAPGLSSSREVPQVDRTRPQTVPARHLA